MYKKCKNNNTLSCAINDNLRHEIEIIYNKHSQRKKKRHRSVSDTARMLIWLGLKYYYLLDNTKKGREKGRAMSVDKLTDEEQQALQAESGIYISKL